MGLLDLFRRKALSASPAVLEGLRNRQVSGYPPLGGVNYSSAVNAAYQRGLDCTYGVIYRTQPAVRSVVDLIARNVAQLPLKCYERVSDTERERNEDHPAAELLANPDGRTPSDAFIYRLVTDYLIFDNAYVLKLRGRGGDVGVLIRLQPQYVSVYGGRFTPEGYVIWRPDGSGLRVPPGDMLHWFGYDPEDPLKGFSKLDTLRQELSQDAAIQETLVQLAKNGLKGGYITRPLEADVNGGGPGQEGLQRIAEQWKAGKVKGDPILDEGMEYHQVGITPKDADLVSSRQFTKQEVADAYGLPMKALMEGDTDARKALYADVLPPIVKTLACELDVSILRGEFDATDYYFEFDLNEKLRGDIESRWQAITATVGRAWQTVNEARALENKPPIEGGDELAVQANVMLVDEDGTAINPNPNTPQLPAPNVMPPQDPNAPPQDGSYRQQAALTKALEITTQPRRKADMDRQKRYIDEAKALLERFYARQAQTLKSNKAVFDSARWNRELSDDLHKFLASMVEREAGLYVNRLAGNDFDMRQVAHYLEAMAQGTAEALNQVTQRNLEDGTAVDAIDRARNERAAIAAANIGARATHFARQEAAKQAPNPERRMQTWIADTDRHADLDGVSVPLGSDWGGISPGSEPNCACSAEIR